MRLGSCVWEDVQFVEVDQGESEETGLEAVFVKSI